MTDVETLAERVRTVERAVTDGDHELPDLEDRAELETRLTAVEDRLDRLDERAAELEAATQALRGYVGNVRSVNEDVERRADSALAATERLERRLDAVAGDQPGGSGRSDEERAGGHAQTQRHSPDPTPDARSAERANPDRQAPPAADGPTPPATDNPTTPVGDGGESEQPTTAPDGGVLERIRALL